MDYSEYSLVITGHSLGGAVSQVLLLLMMLFPPACIPNFHQKVTAYTTGSPPVFSEEASLVLHSNLFNLILKHDLIPRL